jgi:hypothetical protein
LDVRDHGVVRTDGEAVDLAERLAALLDGGRVTRLKAGHVRVDRADVGDAVRREIEHARRVPLTDDSLLPYSEAHRLAEDLRRFTA